MLQDYSDRTTALAREALGQNVHWLETLSKHVKAFETELVELKARSKEETLALPANLDAGNFLTAELPKSL